MADEVKDKGMNDLNDLPQSAAVVQTSEDHFRTPGNRAFSIFICIFASMGGLYFGYDQGVTGGMLTMRSFREDFCVPDKISNCTTDEDDIPKDFQDFITLYNVLYNIGSIFGGLLGGQVADRFGRRAAVFFAALTFNVGTWWVITTQKGMIGVCLSGRILEGIGVGSSSFSAPLYAAEAAPKEFRGALAGFSQMAIVTGLLASAAVNIAVEGLDNGWRITNGVITAPPVLMMLVIFFLPESPRFLYQRKGEDKARAELRRIRRSDDIEVEFQSIGEQVALEVGNGRATYGDCFSRKVRKRTFIAISLQILQQATGINPIFTYGGLIFNAVTSNTYLALFTLATVNFLSTIPSLYWVERFGRRFMLLLGAIGMCCGHLLAGTTFVIWCKEDEDGDIGCTPGTGELMVVFSAIFIFFFAISWGPIGWIYPSEIFPLHVRAKCVSLSTAANWAMGSLMIAVVQLFPIITIAGVFYLFAVLCVGCYTFVYFMCPETKGIMLEDIEYLFSNQPIPEKKLKEDPQLAEAGHIDIAVKADV